MREKVYRADKAISWEKVDNKTTIFIDTNVWIDVAEERGTPSASIKSRLSDLAKAGKIICPLSAPLIWELYKQNQQSQLQIACFMDRLSLGVCYRIAKEIFNAEIRRYIQQLIAAELPDSIGEVKKNIYVPVSHYLSSVYGISYPSSWPDNQIAAFEKIFCETHASMSLEQFVRMMQTGLKGDSHPIKKINTLRYPQEPKERWEYVKGNRDKLVRIEAETIARNYLLPLINKLPLELRLIILSKTKGLPKDKYNGCLETMLDNMPSLKNHTELMAMSAVNPSRKAKPSDFFDLEMLAVPLAYADVIVSQDKWMRDIVCERGTFLKRNNCKYLSSLNEFNLYLESL